MTQRILVTSALPYANGPLHLGHLAGAYLPADVFCRYHRSKGHDVVYICGSDEHGVPIMLRARKEGVPAQQVVDAYHAEIEAAFQAFSMSFDHYGRTSAPLHRETSQAWFAHLAKKGAFKLKTEEQFYDPQEKLFLADRFIVGTCPNCDYQNAYGDQCEKCGKALSPKELISPRSAISDTEPQLRETTHWYLPLGDLQPELEAWLSTKEDWKANVKGQVKSWLTAGLSDRAMTRDIPWGVPVPSETAAAAGVDAEGKVLYVWFDAPIGYVSSTRQWAEEQGDSELWKAYWQSEDARLVHFIGKDNIVFHTIIFPALLKLHGDYVLPENVPANEFLNLEGDKFSTSRGWAVWAHEALKDFSADYLRYALLRILPETRDADFTWAEFQAHVNNELADNLGNFFNRSVQFAVKYFEGIVPPLEEPTEADRDLLSQMATFPARIGEMIDAYRFRDAIQEVMALGRLGNKYFNDQEPWRTRKDDLKTCGNTIHVSMQLCAALSILIEPFLPDMALRMRSVLDLEGVRATHPNPTSGTLGWDSAGAPLLVAGHRLGTPEILVQKVADEAVEEQRMKLEEASKKTETLAYEPLGSEIVYDDFAKLDLRVGRVTFAEKVKKSKKLIRCEVDLGFEKRQILAGVAEHLAPEDLVDSQVIVVANLKPRKMLGLQSQGMILMATDRNGALLPITSASEPGARVS